MSYLSDASFITGGYADRVVLPKSIEEVAEVLAAANRDRVPVTISGAGTGTVGGRVPFGGIVLATDKLNRIKTIESNRAVAEAGVVLADFQRAVDSKGLLYPPDPTERGCFLGGTVATNASGARTFKYGPTRNYIERLKLVLASGEILDLRRGDKLPEIPIPTYRPPATRKNAMGYFVSPGMDAIDLFIGSEGTLAVICEIEMRLVPKPEGLLSGIVFFADEADVLAFVAEARARSLENRERDESGKLEARALEFFDNESLNFLRQKYPKVPDSAAGAIFFEQESTDSTEESVLNQWLALLDQHHAFADSWFATNEQDQARLREFRHQLPVLMNEWFAHYRQRKVSTDMAVPDEAFAGLFRLYQETLRSSGLRYTIFGHIGDNHVHVNILPRNDNEAARARDLYVPFLKYAASVGGTLSAEHGIGKLKRDYLRLFYSDDQLREMAALKKTLDPNGILGRGNIFSEDLLNA